MGANVAPTGVKVVDARGANVYPGFIDAAARISGSTSPAFAATTT